jgi:hypothetical protein
MTNNTPVVDFDKNEFLKLVEQVSAVSKQDRIIMYFTEKQRLVFEECFDVKIDSDDCEFDTHYGFIRFLMAQKPMVGDISMYADQNKIFIL